ncbi:hypothetical protein [Mixta intestinalis]|uniref:Uncharacterized protein n=1 Tax=Mixta intestinalis TaxID=1615494 RepID=A0A6P1Q4C6_9GAMM|nr:hypothetical protein [Mixta intestinalis]QHM73251.1 hypothetical protein C7M51_03596 [Mixta intestinalis]
MVNKKRLREIILIPGILFGWVCLSSAGVTPQGGLSILPESIAWYCVILTSVFGTVELLMRIALLIFKPKQ